MNTAKLITTKKNFVKLSKVDVKKTKLKDKYCRFKIK